MLPITPVFGYPPSRREVLIGATAALAAPILRTSAARAASLPVKVPPGTALVVADQNEELQTLMGASGEQARLVARITYANFIGGPAILEAFRAGALDLATVGNTPPIQAQAAGERIPIVAARTTARSDYNFATRPGLKIEKLTEFRGKRIAYGEGTGRQPFVLTALKLAGLTKRDVTLIPLRSADFPDAVRSGQVDIAALDEPQFSRYLADNAAVGAGTILDSENDRLPRSLEYLYASGTSLADAAKTAAIRDFVIRWIASNKWSRTNLDTWINSYYVKRENLSLADGRKIEGENAAIAFPLLKNLVAQQQGLIDLIHEAGDIPKQMDAKDEFDLRFDEVIATNG